MRYSLRKQFPPISPRLSFKPFSILHPPSSISLDSAFFLHPAFKFLQGSTEKLLCAMGHQFRGELTTSVIKNKWKMINRFERMSLLFCFRAFPIHRRNHLPLIFLVRTRGDGRWCNLYTTRIDFSVFRLKWI